MFQTKTVPFEELLVSYLLRVTFLRRTIAKKGLKLLFTNGQN